MAQDNPGQPLDIIQLQKKGKLPRAIRQAAPAYPFDLAQAGLTGQVKVSFIIDREGSVQNAYVVESNNPAFERSAIDAVSQWKFTPGEIEGRPVNVLAQQMIEFKMEDGGQAADIWRVSKSKEHDKLPPEFRWETPPRPRQTTFPVYPFAQLKAGTAGKARIAFIVGPNGRVLKSQLCEATAPEFGAAVQATIDAWEFEPARKKDGTPCYATLDTAYDFKPSGRGEVPVSEEARSILLDLEKNPKAIVRASELDQALKPMSRRPPVYPSALAKGGQTGEAVIEFFIDRNGDAQLPRIISSSAPEFGYAAAQAVAAWRFQAPMKNKKPMVVPARIAIEFVPPETKPIAPK